jgi:hypothetical protein
LAPVWLRQRSNAAREAIMIIMKKRFKIPSS